MEMEMKMEMKMSNLKELWNEQSDDTREMEPEQLVHGTDRCPVQIEEMFTLSQKTLPVRLLIASDQQSHEEYQAENDELMNGQHPQNELPSKYLNQ